MNQSLMENMSGENWPGFHDELMFMSLTFIWSQVSGGWLQPIPKHPKACYLLSGKLT